MYVTLNEAKKHLNIDETFTDDDLYIISLIEVAEDGIAKNCDIVLADQVEAGVLPASLKHCILLMVGNLYNSRESVSFSNLMEVPYSYKYLVNLNRNFTVK